MFVMVVKRYQIRTSSHQCHQSETLSSELQLFLWLEIKPWNGRTRASEATDYMPQDVHVRRFEVTCSMFRLADHYGCSDLVSDWVSYSCSFGA